MDKMNYKKLSRKHGFLFYFNRLWMAPDHLLLVKEAGVVENYKRFYFTDIQSIIMMRTSLFSIGALCLPLVAIILFGLSTTTEAGKPFLSGFAILSIAIWIIHLLRGPTCKCWIQTGINKERLVMLNRVRQVLKFQHMLEPKLTAIQGEFSLEDLEHEGAFVDRSTTAQPPSIPLSVEPEQGAL